MRHLYTNDLGLRQNKVPLTALRINAVKNLPSLQSQQEILHCVQNDMLTFYRNPESFLYMYKKEPFDIISKIRIARESAWTIYR
jgi:hypothetical protein